MWTRKQTKRQSWKAYISSLTSLVSAKESMNRFHKIQGDYCSFTIPLIAPGSSSSASLVDQVNLLGEYFAEISCSGNYSKTFGRYKAIAGRQQICMFGGDSAPYNQPFTSSELEVVIGVPKPCAPGLDGIRSAMLQNLSFDSRQALLAFYNFLWDRSVFPEDWKSAHVIPLWKPGKDRSLTNNYRPIALTSCLCKTYERLINMRLMYVLESNNILDVNQCGFRAWRSTLDHLVRLETVVQEAFVRRQRCVSVFSHLQKACDSIHGDGVSYVMCTHTVFMVERPGMYKVFASSKVSSSYGCNIVQTLHSGEWRSARRCSELYSLCGQNKLSYPGDTTPY